MNGLRRQLMSRLMSLQLQTTNGLMSQGPESQMHGPRPESQMHGPRRQPNRPNGLGIISLQPMCRSQP